MGIIDKLKKGKKSESVLDSLVKKKSPQEEAKETGAAKPDDIEVRELNPTGVEKIAMPEDIGMQPIVEEPPKPVHEFRAEGMHEFSLESLGSSPNASLKVEYKSKANKLIDEDKIDEAIKVLQELKQKLAQQK